MGYGIAFLGELTFPPGGYAAWLSAELPPAAAFSDWPDGWAPGRGAHGTVDDALAEVSGDFLTFERGESGVVLRLLVSKDDSFYLDSRAELFAAFRRAAAQGGAGSLVIVGWADAPRFGVRLVVGPGAETTWEELAPPEIEEVERSAAYGALDSLVARELAKLQPPPGEIEARMAEAAADRSAEGESIATAPTLDDALKLFTAALPPEPYSGVLQRHPAVAALAAYPDPETSARVVKRLGDLIGGPVAGKQAWEPALSTVARSQALGCLEVLRLRGDAEDIVFTVWLDHPDSSLRDHEALVALGRRDLHERLVAQLGAEPIGGLSAFSQKGIVDALFALDAEGAPARATSLHEGDVRRNAGALEALRWIVTYLFSHPELRSPAWETWLRNASASPPWTTNVYDFYDQLRRNAIGVMAYWKMPEALAPLLEHFDAFGPDRACELLVALGDPSALPVLEAKRAKTKRAAERASIDRAILKFGGTPPAPVPARASAIEPAPSGRAACRGCKEKIAKGELRFGEAVKNVFSDDGEPTMRWYHLRCAAQKKAALLGAALEAHVGEVPEREALVRTAAEGMAKGKGKKKG